MIVFKKLTFCNFLSVGNTPVTIDLNKNKTTLIHGVNGSGKSTVLDAICYALFSKPFRKVNLSQLCNTQNKKGLFVELEFSIGRNSYVVHRGMKPKIFKIFKNKELLLAKAADKDNQRHLEQNILKLTYKSFTQIVILGSSNFVPFMQLPTVGRRECVEDFLDIKVFSAMSIIAKERLRGLKDHHLTLEGDIGNLTYKLDLQKDRIRELEVQSSTNIQEIEDTISGRMSEVDNLEGLIARTREHEKDVIEIAKQELQSNPQKKQKEMNKILIQLQNKIDKFNNEISFFEDNTICPTCSQDITDEITNTIRDRNESEVSKLTEASQKAMEQLKEYEDTLRVVSGRQKHVQSLQGSILKYQTTIESHQLEIGRLNRKLRELKDDTSSVDKEIGKLELMEDDLKLLRDKIFDLQLSIQEHESVNNMLKDNGIKTQIVKKYLPVMNKMIRNYLTQLDFPIHFILDNEFNESISSPLHQNFSYASFSEGQKARIDLALMFTWREIGKIKNSVTTNLLILDEVFSSSLDEAGKELLMSLLRYRLDDNQNVLVVDHTLSGTFKDKFDRTIEVSKTKGFSHYS